MRLSHSVRCDLQSTTICVRLKHIPQLALVDDWHVLPFFRFFFAQLDVDKAPAVVPDRLLSIRIKLKDLSQAHVRFCQTLSLCIDDRVHPSSTSQNHSICIMPSPVFRLNTRDSAIFQSEQSLEGTGIASDKVDSALCAVFINRFQSIVGVRPAGFGVVDTFPASMITGRIHWTS